MNWADWLIASVLLISALISMKRGFVKEVLSLIVWVVAFVIATWFKEPVGELFTPWLDAVSMRQLLAFILIFIVVLIIGGVINHSFGRAIEIVGLRTADRLFGVLFGLARGVLLFLVAIIYLPRIVPVHQDAWWHNSVFIPHFTAIEDNFFTWVFMLYDAIVELL